MQTSQCFLTELPVQFIQLHLHYAYGMKKITVPDIVMIFLLLFAIASEARSSFSLEIQYIPLHVLNSVNDRILYILMISILKLTLDIDNRNVHLKIILH